VQGGHLDGEGEQVVDEGVQELVHHGAGGHVRDGFQPVVDVERWYHHQEAVRVDGADERRDDEAVPRLVGLVKQ